MKFKKYLQSLFKKVFQKLFSVLYGKIHNLEKLPQNKFTKYNVDCIQLDAGNFTLDNNIHKIIDGRVYTDTVEHVAIIKDNILLYDISYQQIDGELKNSEFNKVLITGTPRLIKKINGTVLSLVQGVSGENYFHFLFDIITKLKICEQEISLDKIDFFYVSGNIEWQDKIFSLVAFKVLQDLYSSVLPWPE